MTVADAGHATGFRFPEPDHRTLLLGLRAPQLAVLGVIIVVALMVLVTVPTTLGVAGALMAFAVGAPAALVRVQGRTIDQWVPVAARWKLRVVLGHNRWRSSVPGLGDSATRAERAAPPPPLAGVTLLRAARSGGGDLAVVKDGRGRSYSAVVACRGRAFALLDAAEQQRLCALWGQAIASFAHEGSPVTRLAWVERTVPGDGDALKDHLAANAVLAPHHPAHAAYAQLLGDAGSTSRERETFVVVSIGGRRARRAIGQAGGGDRGACEVLAREVSSLVDRLRLADVDGVDVLGSRQLAGVLRVAFDPRAGRPLARRARREVVLSGTTGRNAWPLATETGWSHYRTDSGVHTTYWMGGLPRRDVEAAFLCPLLLRPSGQHTVAVVMEPVPPRAVARAAESAHASHVADEELRARAGYLPSARRRRLHEAILDREAELAGGHAECRFSGYVTVTATNLDELELLAAEMEGYGYDANVELRRLYGEQDTAFTYTLPLARGLS
ncbi:MAG: SCO6880 family protein [Acidimicrobiales bacterium]